MDERVATLSPESLLKTLRGYDFLAGFSLALYSCNEGEEAHPASTCQLPAATRDSSIFSAICPDTLDENLRAATAGNRPTIFHCPAGLLYFAIPLGTVAIPHLCLVGCGVREDTLDFHGMEALARTSNIDPIMMLEQLESLPVATKEEVAAVAQKVYSMLSSFPREEPHARFIEKTMERLNAIVGISAEMDRTETAAGAVSLLTETLGILFDIPALAVAVPASGSKSFSLQGTLGIPGGGTDIPADKLTGILPPDAIGRIELAEEEIEELFPTVKAASATCFPLASDGELLGLVTLFDMALPARDLLMVELLAGKVATRLLGFKREEEFSQESTLARNLLDMVGTLAMIEEQKELFNAILEMAAGLVHASCGSLMLLDGKMEAMQIEAAIGMNMQLARSLNVKVGNGIAGKVAESGHPMLVNDIEKDCRVTGVNRPRFKTKSFISIPFKFREHTIGVLNLSDKKEQGIFTEADLDLLTAFVTHAAAMIQRSRSMARAETLERLCVTDPLTELFNRRFLEKRMEEELSRSTRQGFHLTVMLIDLDNFKAYNDLCGHLAGDKALKRTARVLSRSVREMDVVTRYGGEEFCVLLPGTSKKESIFVAERIRRGIENEKFSGEENLPLGRLTTSIGLASFPEDGNTFETLINTADIALYQAKAGGRNRVILAESTKAPLAAQANDQGK